MWRSGICAGKDTWINRSMIRFGWCKADVHRTLCPRQGARGLLMDDTAVESAFTLLLTKVTKPPYPAKVSPMISFIASSTACISAGDALDPGHTIRSSSVFPSFRSDVLSPASLWFDAVVCAESAFVLSELLLSPHPARSDAVIAAIKTAAAIFFLICVTSRVF